MTLIDKDRVTGAAGGAEVRPAAPRRQPYRVKFASWWWAVPAIVIAFVTHYVAVGFGGIYAFTNWRGIGTFDWIGLDNFVTIFQTDGTRTAIFNSLLIAIAFTVGTNVIGLGFALALNRGLRTRYVLRIILFAPVVLSSLAISYIWKFVFDVNGPLNQLLGAVGLEHLQRTWLGDPSTALVCVMIVVVWQGIGMTMVIYLAGLANVPEEIDEAASMDGAGAWSRFFYVTLPLLRPAVLIAFTLVLIRGLGVFDQIIALTNGGPYGATDTLTTLGYTETFVNGKFGYGSALSLVLTAIAVVFALLQVLVLREKKEK